MSFATLAQRFRHKPKKEGIPTLEEIMKEYPDVGEHVKRPDKFAIPGITDAGYAKEVDDRYAFLKEHGLAPALEQVLFKQAGGNYSEGYPTDKNPETSAMLDRRKENARLGGEAHERAHTLIQNVVEARWQAAAGNPDGQTLITQSQNELADVMVDTGLVTGKNEALKHARDLAASESVTTLLTRALPKIGVDPKVLEKTGIAT